MAAFRSLLSMAVVGCFCQFAAADSSEKYVEIRIGDAAYSGVITAHNETDFWLLQSDGRLKSFAVKDVTDYQALPGRMRPESPANLRARLVREFGQSYNVTGSRHYLVAAANGRAEAYASLFEELYRHTYVYFSARGFHIHEPEFPLVAVVMPDRGEFIAYCLQEKVNPQPGLMGYYMPSSNRVALYDSTSTGGSADGLDATIIHEAVHQAAFNLGLHRRIGESPLWMVEGLAMAFESESFRNPLPTTTAANRINRDRYARFRSLTSKDRSPTALEDLIRDDELFKTATLDAYAQSWALTFYLLQTRDSQYAHYLRLVNARPALAAYEANDRLADFRTAFGKEPSQIDAELVRYMNGLLE